MDQLLEVSAPGTRTTFAYDPLGDRIATTAAGSSTYTVYDENHSRHLVLDAGGHLQARYVDGPQINDELGVNSDSSWTYPVLDSKSTAIMSTTATGSIAGRESYDSFGLTDSAAVAGQQWHGMPAAGPVGLLLSWARAYDPATGRFLTEDPVDAVNRYVYGEDSPTTVTDPLGLDTTEYTESHHLVPQRAGIVQAARDKFVECFGSIHGDLNREDVAASVHQGLHTQFYYGWVNALINEDTTCEGVFEALGLLIEYVSEAGG